MADYKYENLPLVAKHVPDYSLETGPDGNKRQEELPGHIHIGTVIDGVFKALASFKAAGLFADIERAKQSQGDTAAASEPQVQQSGTGVDVPQGDQTQQPTPQVQQTGGAGDVPQGDQPQQQA